MSQQRLRPRYTFCIFSSKDFYIWQHRPKSTCRFDKNFECFWPAPKGLSSENFWLLFCLRKFWPKIGVLGLRSVIKVFLFLALLLITTRERFSHFIPHILVFSYFWVSFWDNFWSALTGIALGSFKIMYLIKNLHLPRTSLVFSFFHFGLKFGLFWSVFENTQKGLQDWIVPRTYSSISLM